MMLSLTAAMARNVKRRRLSKQEQIALYEQFLPLKNAIAARLTKYQSKQSNVFRGGYSKLFLRAIYSDLASQPQYRQAKRAFDRLISHNEALAVSLAHRYARAYPHVDADDLVQAGMVGLVYALFLYNPYSGKSGGEVKYSSYATPWVKALIVEHIKADKTIRPPSSVKSYDYKFISVIRDADGETSDIFDHLPAEPTESIGDRLMAELSQQEQTAFLEPPLFAAMTIGCTIDEVEAIKQRAKERVLAV